MLSLDDFLGMEFTPNMTGMDYLLAVSEVSYLKSMFGQEDDLIAEQEEEYRIKKEERITQNIRSMLSSSQQVVGRQEKAILDLVVPRGKRSMPNARPRKVTGQFLCNVAGESMIKKAVENNSEEHRISWGEVANSVVRSNIPIVHVSNQEFVKAADYRETKVIKIKYKGSANFSPLPIKKRPREEVANNGPLGFNNQERFQWVEKSEAKRAKKRKVIVKAKAPKSSPVVIKRELNMEFKNMITLYGGSLESVQLVIEKVLFYTDVNKSEGRLSIPVSQMSNKFLKPEEEALLDTRNGKKVCEMNVALMEPSCRVGEINLRKWNMKSSSSYVLTTYWNEVTRWNGFEAGTKVQLWAFRKEEKLCFLLVKV
ncbi:unnamed protein product [Withania somnifera]